MLLRVVVKEEAGEERASTAIYHGCRDSFPVVRSRQDAKGGFQVDVPWGGAPLEGPCSDRILNIVLTSTQSKAHQTHRKKVDVRNLRPNQHGHRPPAEGSHGWKFRIQALRYNAIQESSPALRDSTWK